MESPFVFGQVVSGAGFVNRTDELNRLIYNVRSGVSTILISPRRWGKSSLVREMARRLESEDDLVFCFLDVFAIQSEEDFFEAYAKAVLKAFESDWEGRLRTAQKLLSGLVPLLSFKADPNADFSIKFKFEKGRKDAGEILDLGQKLAAERGKRLVVCIDEFQSVEQFEDPLGFQKLLRAHWQLQTDVSFVLYGSKRHSMQQLFAERSYPFFKFGEVILLERISIEHWVPFIQKSFSDSGRMAPEIWVRSLVERMQRHTQYVQHLAHLALFHTPEGSELTEAILDQAQAQLIQNQTAYFQSEFLGLSKTQVSVLRMLLDGIQSEFTSSAHLKRYGLNSSATVVKAFAALENKDIIDRLGPGITFTDPVFALWLKDTLA
jgi:AAA+ ATPase superfamily predicted ATPase